MANDFSLARLLLEGWRKRNYSPEDGDAWTFGAMANELLKAYDRRGKRIEALEEALRPFVFARNAAESCGTRGDKHDHPRDHVTRHIFADAAKVLAAGEDDR